MIIIMRTLILSLTFACMASLADLAAQTQLVTHRGYWDCEGSAENSIASLKKSKDVNAYGSELDVIITQPTECRLSITIARLMAS